MDKQQEVKVTVMLDPSLVEQAKIEAVRSGCTLKQLIARGLAHAVAEQKAIRTTEAK